MFDTFDRLWRALAEDGTITQAEYRATNFPQCYRTVDQFAAPFRDPESAVSRAGLRLAEFRDLTDRARDSVLAQAQARGARLNRIPPPFRRWARELSAVEGSARYEEWMTGKRCYYLARLEKPLGEKA